jgi:hypothetical protein
VRDTQQRESLIDRLADLPIEMSDVDKIRTKRKELEKSAGELDLWRATQQIEWAEKFRKHYREVEAEAR